MNKVEFILSHISEKMNLPSTSTTTADKTADVRALVTFSFFNHFKLTSMFDLEIFTLNHNKCHQTQIKLSIRFFFARDITHANKKKQKNQFFILLAAVT